MSDGIEKLLKEIFGEEKLISKDKGFYCILDSKEKKLVVDLDFINLIEVYNEDYSEKANIFVKKCKEDYGEEFSLSEYF